MNEAARIGFGARKHEPVRKVRQKTLHLRDGQAKSWLDQPPSTIVHPGPPHLTVLAELPLPLYTGGNLISDTHLAIEHRAERCSSDADFA